MEGKPLYEITAGLLKREKAEGKVIHPYLRLQYNQ